MLVGMKFRTNFNAFKLIECLSVTKSESQEEKFTVGSTKNAKNLMEPLVCSFDCARESCKLAKTGNVIFLWVGMR